MKPKMTDKQLDEISTAETAHISDYHDREDAKQEWMLGAWEASLRAKEGMSVRTYQWRYGRGRVLSAFNKIVRYKKRNFLVIDKPIGEDGVTAAEHIHDIKAKSPDEDICRDEVENLIAEVMGVLDDRSAEIVRLCVFKGLTLGEVGDKFGLSRERMRQLRDKAFDKMRRVIVSNKRYKDILLWFGYSESE